MNSDRSLPWHDGHWQRLLSARKADRLPHALLLSGPSGIGKSAFARRLSDSLVCPSPGEGGDACRECSACRMSAAGSHPDQHLIEPEAAGKAIKIDTVREISNRSVLAAQDGAYRVFVIDPADGMNRAAANALLKTLEEPAPRSLMVLVSSHPDRLPATIRSRCQALKFRVPDPKAARQWLRQQLDDSATEALLAISAGAPLRALEAREQDWLGEDRRLVSELEALKGRKNNPLQIVEDWGNRPLTLVMEGLKRCLADLVRLVGDAGKASLYHPDMRGELQTLGQGIDLRELFSFNDELLAMERSAANNLNVSMMLEHIVNRWLQITRPGGR